MKKIFFLLSVISIFSACDKIDNPLKEGVIKCEDCTATDNDPYISEKAILIEDFTGITCNNCPKAATTAKEIEDKYPGRVHTIGIHCSNFAVPDPDKGYTEDFRVKEGIEIYDFAEPTGVPSGMVDRSDFGSSSFVKPYFAWAGTADNILTSTTTANIGIAAEVKLDTANSSICLTTKFKNNVDMSNKEVYWCAFLTESHIIAQQKMPDNSANPTYEHNHVMRAAFNGAFGSILTELSGPSNNLACDSRALTINPEWELKNCAVIVYAYQRDTYEILQVIEVELEP